MRKAISFLPFRPAMALLGGLIFSFLTLFVSVSAQAEDLLDVRNAPDQPVKIIYDTDMGNDADDALALAILHAMVNRQKCELLGITLTKSNLFAARYCKAFNAQYGHPDVPIGLVRDGKTKDSGRYVQKICEMKKADGTTAFPIPEGWEPEDSIVLLRKLLAAAEDHSIVIVQVGFSTNLARLLDTPADDISPLTGRELAAKKVRLVSLMGGAFTFKNDKFIQHREFNIVEDVPAAQKLCKEWPTPVIFSGFELGVEIMVRDCTVLNDYLQPAPNILKESHLLYHEGRGLAQPTWDLTCVLFVVRPEKDRGYFTLSAPGTVTVRDDGTTFFTEDPNGSHRCFLTTPEQNIRIEEAFVNLCSEH